VKQERGWSEFKERVIAQNPGLVAFGNLLPALPSECSHADVARYFMKHEPAAKNHIQLYDLGQRAVFVGTRWTVGDAGDRCSCAMSGNAATTCAGTCLSRATPRATIGPS